MSAAEEKDSIRRELLSKRLTLSPKETTDYSEKIVNTLTKSINLDSLNRIHIYSPIKKYNEVDTLKFIEFLANNHPGIDVVTAPNKALLSTEVPKGGSYDLVIVPVLGFDRHGFRLGYGGGYYDKFLAGNKYSKAVGLAYSFCELSVLPNEPHDIKLDGIITENEAIFF